MSATQELIAAALSAADELGNSQWPYFRSHAYISELADNLLNACARAMVQPDIAEVERLADAYANAFFCTKPVIEIIEARAALLDAVRAIVSERDALIADNERLSSLYEQAVTGRADMRSALREARAAAPQPVSTHKIIAPTDPDYADSEAYLRQQPVSAAEVPMPDIAGELFDGTKVCYESNVRTYGDAREAAGYAAGVAAGGKDAERYRLLRDGQSWPAVFNQHNAPEPLRGIDLDAAIDAALRGEVKP